MNEPCIRVHDVLYPRLRVPDLDRMEEFATDFGMKRSARTVDALYLRGDGTQHHLHVVERGEPAGMIGFAFLAASADDLDRLSACPGASAVHDIDEPGGGRRVVLTDPHGFVVEVVHGIESSPPTMAPSLPLNLGARVERRAAVKRLPRRPARIRRLGHIGINVPDVAATFEWYRARFGLLKSDVVAVSGLELVHFCRCDRGAAVTDHHTLLISQAQSSQASFNHASWEVGDLDDLWLGHEVLAAKSYRHHWGIGRHTLGSQIFDYWRDPWGHVHEHFTDGDLLDASHPVGVYEPGDAGSQWGPEIPADFGQPLPD